MENQPVFRNNSKNISSKLSRFLRFFWTLALWPGLSTNNTFHLFRRAVAIVHVYFENGNVIKYERHELFTTSQLIGKKAVNQLNKINLKTPSCLFWFIGNVGGLLGLCMGFSLVSGVEMIYFCTCRWLLRREKSIALEP